MGPSRLPAELTDRIIDFCHNDKKTLSNCALTHSSWLAASRFHLFHTLSTTGAFEKTDRAIQLKSILQTRRYTISRGWPSILPYIRTVKIELSFTYNGGARLINAAHLADTICCLLYLVDLPSPSVHVSLSQPSQFLLSPAHALRSFPPVSHNVTFVRLSGVTFTHPNDIWPFLSSFPRLQYLELESVGFNKSADSSLPAESLFDGIPLTTMRLATASMGLVIRGLVRAASSLSHLEDFGIAYQDLRQGEVSQLVDSIQRRVKCLRFSSSCYPGDERNGESRPSVFDISEYIGLHLHNPKIDGLDIWQRSRNLSDGFVHLKRSFWMTSGWTDLAATVDPTCPSNGSQAYCNNFLRQFGNWYLK